MEEIQFKPVPVTLAHDKVESYGEGGAAGVRTVLVLTPEIYDYHVRHDGCINGYLVQAHVRGQCAGAEKYLVAVRVVLTVAVNIQQRELIVAELAGDNVGRSLDGSGNRVRWLVFIDIVNDLFDTDSGFQQVTVISGCFNRLSGIKIKNNAPGGYILPRVFRGILLCRP